MKMFTWLKTHVLYHRELYVFLPLVVLLILGALVGVPLLTGRAVIDDPGALVGTLYSGFRIAVSAMLTGLIQAHLIGYRSEESTDGKFEEDLFRDHIYDGIVALVLFGFITCQLA